MELISILSVPLMIVGILLFGLAKRVKVYEVFVQGAADGLSAMLKIFPSLLGLIVSVSMLRASGAFTCVEHFLQPVTEKIGIPSALLPLMLMRPVSGSGSTAVITDIFKNYSPDSFVGLCASVMMGSTETTFYTIAVYYGTVGITKIRHTVKAALVADIVGMLGSILAVRLLIQR